MLSHNTTRKVLLGVSLLSIAYLGVIGYIFLHRHRRIPSGELPNVLTGTFVVNNDTNYQIPDVFRGKTLTLEKSNGASYQMVDEKGNILPLQQGADGLYFTEDFRPVGAWILPGIARNWNEGRITLRDDMLTVEGHMLEMGLMLFVFPFKDVTDWRVELTTAPNNPMHRSGEADVNQMENQSSPPRDR